MKELQKLVDAWIGQFKEGYWPDMRILAQQAEELSEVADALRNSPNSDLANSRGVGGAQFFTEMQQLGMFARAFSQENGKAKKKAPDDETSLSSELADLLFSVICLANKHKIDLDQAFREMMDKKLGGRDKNRFERK